MTKPAATATKRKTTTTKRKTTQATQETSVQAMSQSKAQVPEQPARIPLNLLNKLVDECISASPEELAAFCKKRHLTTDDCGRLRDVINSVQARQHQSDDTPFDPTTLKAKLGSLYDTKRRILSLSGYSGCALLK